MISGKYIPELYWDEVAKQIDQRRETSLVAGDDEPYYRYKREKFLGLLDSIEFTGKKVLEVGPGPGGNLLVIYKHQPAELYGADISERMIGLARRNTSDSNIHLVKTNGSELPFDTGYFDIVLTATVLQHITDEQIVATLIRNMCKVASTDIYIFERIERKRSETESNTGRTIDEYAALFASNGFNLYNTRFASTHISYIACGVIRKIFNRKGRKEGEKGSRFSEKVQQIILPLTKQLDKLSKRKGDLAMLHFKRADRAI